MRGTIIAPIKWFQEHWVWSPSRASKLQSTGRFWKLPWFCSRRRIPATSLIRPCLCYFLLTSTEILCWCVQPAQHTQYSLLTLGLHGQHILVSITPMAEDHGETFMPTPIWPLTSRGMSSILLSSLPDYPLRTSRVAGPSVYLLVSCLSEQLCALQNNWYLLVLHLRI